MRQEREFHELLLARSQLKGMGLFAASFLGLGLHAAVLALFVWIPEPTGHAQPVVPQPGPSIGAVEEPKEGQGTAARLIDKDPEFGPLAKPNQPGMEPHEQLDRRLGSLGLLFRFTINR